jgi:integral membrane protein
VLKLFRYIALFEGVTTLALFLIAMPLKYGFDNPSLVPPVGMTHGIAFLLYIAAMLVALPGKGFGPVGWLRTILASLFPFGTFLNDGYIKRREAANSARYSQP